MRDDADARRQAEILAGVLKTSLDHVAGDRGSSHQELPKLPEPPVPIVMDADAIAAAAAKAAAQVLQQHQQQQQHTDNGGDGARGSADGRAAAEADVKPPPEDPDKLSTMQLRLLQAELQYKVPLQKWSLDDVSQAIQAKWNNTDGKHIPKLIDDSIKRLGGNNIIIPKAKADRIALLWRLFKAV